MSEENKESSSRRRQSGRKPGDLVFVACLLIGIGVGIALNQVAVGVLIGLGFGFICMAIMSLRNKE
jgi:hypothetical protein